MAADSLQGRNRTIEEDKDFEDPTRWGSFWMVAFGEGAPEEVVFRLKTEKGGGLTRSPESYSMESGNSQAQRP